jgi:hypothetical protein
MRIRLSYITPLLATGAAAVAIAAAPTATAAPTAIHKTCSSSGSGSTCQSPGNVEVNSSPPAVSFYPYGTMPFLIGGGGYRPGR